MATRTMHSKKQMCSSSRQHCKDLPIAGKVKNKVAMAKYFSDGGTGISTTGSAQHRIMV